MTALGVDYAWQHPSPSAIAQAGYQFVLRYLSGDPSKNLSGQEVTGLQAAGLSIGLVWESTADRALSGGQGGAQDGQQAVQQARALGYPVGSVIFANVGDFAATPAQIPAIDAYYQGFEIQVVGSRFEPGGYGTGYIIDQLASRGRQGYWWQNAMNDQGEPGSQVSGNAHIYQRVSPTRPVQGAQPGSYDEDVLLKPVPLWGKAVIPNPNPDPGPVNPGPPPPFTIGDNVQVIPVQGKTDAAGWYAGGIPLPAGVTKDHICGIVMDWGSGYDGGWNAVTAGVDYQNDPSGAPRFVIRGNPNSFYTGRVYVSV